MPQPSYYKAVIPLILALHQPNAPTWSAELEQAWQIACQVHGIASYLQPAMREAEWLPESLKVWAEAQHAANSQRIARLHRDLQTILALFAAHELPLMPMKGALLTAQAYPDPGLRPMADLDLLIHPADFERARDLLGQLGYQPTIHHWKHTEFIQPDNQTVVDATCEHPDNPRKLELHLYCRENFGGPIVDITDLMWGQAHLSTWLGQPAWLPSTATLALHLLVHASYHFWQGRGRLIQLLDLEQLYQHEPEPFENPQKLLTLLHSIEARYTYPSLLLWHKYAPSAVNYALMISQRARVSPQFHHWADSLDLINSSHLNPNASGLYLIKALRFSEGRPREVSQALRFALLPHLDEILLDHPKLAQSRWPWLAYGLLPLDWLKRLRRAF